MEKTRELRIPEAAVLEAFGKATQRPMPESDEDAHTTAEWAAGYGWSKKKMLKHINVGLEAGTVEKVMVWRRDAAGRVVPLSAYKLVNGRKPGDGGG